eukprot:SAG25_NODE_319_length_9948_cov_30.028328_1_plen_132_part_00
MPRLLLVVLLLCSLYLLTWYWRPSTEATACDPLFRIDIWPAQSHAGPACPWQVCTTSPRLLIIAARSPPAFCVFFLQPRQRRGISAQTSGTDPACRRCWRGGRAREVHVCVRMWLHAGGAALRLSLASTGV